MSDLKQINNAENHLIVGSLEVLGDIEGSSMKTIKRTVSKLAESVQATNTAMENYWGGIGADNIVTPAEKEILYSKWQTLEQTFTAIRKIATDREITDTADYITLHELYDNLHDYIFNELKLFDEMDSKTVLPDTEHFNELFENYYKQQINFQSILSSTTTTIRTVSNLNAAGTENEVVIYKNRFFKYSNGKWVSFDSPEYEGVLEELPEDIINHYFVAGKQGGFRDTFKIKVNKKYLVNEDEQYVTVSSKLFEYGYIYVYTQYNGWQKVTDKNNWRYTVALNDLIANNIPISTELENYLQAKEDSAVERANQNTNTAINNIHTPVNLGTIISFPPSSYGKDDWFLWGANDTTGTYTYNGTTSTITLKKGYVYKFYSDVWNELDWKINTKNALYYMGFLKEILTIMGQDTSTEYFGTAFIETIIAAKAFINHLTAMTIESPNFDPNANTGYQLDAENGTFTCNGGLFKGNIIAGPLQLMPGKGVTKSLIISKNTDVKTVISNFKKNFMLEQLYLVENGSLTFSGYYYINGTHSYTIDDINVNVTSIRVYDIYSDSVDIVQDNQPYWIIYRKTEVHKYRFCFNNSIELEYMYQFAYNITRTVAGDTKNAYNDDHNFPVKFAFNGDVNNGTQKFKLIGIPNNLNNAETYEVYYDENNFLKIKI